jgi:Ca2+-binding RTX toxin-like protein
MKPKHNHLFRPHLENLEDRRLLAAGISFNAGVVTITGTDAADRAVVTQRRGNLTVVLSGGVSATQTFHKSDVKQIIFDGGAGDDVFVNLSSVRALAMGGDGNDLLIGGRRNDILIGGAGDDILIGGRGNDTLEGGAGNDRLQGNRGNDHLFGEDGDDRLLADPGRDDFHAGTGRDELHVRREDRVVNGPDDNPQEDRRLDDNDLEVEHEHQGGHDDSGHSGPH